jgi:type IV pilus assembly protein PilW
MIRNAFRSDARGFSLVELMVALVVTVIVSGAIYGLLAGGQSAFRREPELSDRQQNARVAMDLIMKDISNAGSGLPPWVQVFTTGLDGCAACPMGLAGVTTDELEMITNDLSRDNEPLCQNPGTANGSNVRLVRNAIAASPPPASPSGPVVILFTDGTWTMRYITSVAAGAAVAGEINCVSGSPTLLNFAQSAADLTAMNPVPGPGGACAANAGIPATGTPPMGTAGTGSCTAAELSFAQVVRYRIRNDAAGVPELQRYDSASAGSGFQPVARGIEDLQVQYTQAGGAVSPGAPAVVTNTWGSLITQVQVTLSSRSEARNIQGATTDANLGTRIRGRLSWTGSPRSTLIALTRQPSPSPTPLWK